MNEPDTQTRHASYPAVESTVTFLHQGVPYLPHYKEPCMYVAPVAGV